MKNVQRVVDSNFDKKQARSGLAAKNLSQMNKLLPQLQLAGKKEKDKATVQASLEERGEKLKALRKKLYSSAVALSKLHVVAKKQQLTLLTAALKKVTSIIDDKPPVGVSKHLKACVNELRSLREGVYVGTAMDKKTLSIIACNKAWEHVDTLIEANKKSVERMKAAAAGIEIDADSEDMYGDIAKVLKQTQKESDNLNALTKRPFVITRVPIIPLSKTTISIDKLKLKGFKADNLGGYPVLHNQLVLGINKSMLNQKDPSKPIKSEDILEQAKKVKSMIEKQYKMKLVFVDEKPYGAQGGAWYWLMPERELNMFASTFPGSRVQLTRFGFAF